MKIVHFAQTNPLNPINGCSLYRHINPSRAMSSMGEHSLVILTNQSSEKERQESLKHARSADVVVVGRYFPWQDIINATRKAGRYVVFEVDDSPHLSPKNNMYQTSISNRWVEMFEMYAKNCDAVTVTTEALSMLVTPFNDNVFVYPNMIEYDLPQWNAPRTQRMRGDKKVVMGYFGASSHLYDLAFIADPIRKVISAEPSASWWFGALPTTVMYNNYDTITGRSSTKVVRSRKSESAMQWKHVFKKIPGSRKKYLYPKEIDEYGATYAEFDIAVVPLEDEPFNHYKSNLKILEAAAYNLPVVASDVTPYVEIIEESGGGILCSSADDFYHALRKLVKNESLRLDMGKKMGDYAREHYDLKRNAGVYKKIIDEIVSVPPKPYSGDLNPLQPVMPGPVKQRFTRGL